MSVQIRLFMPAIIGAVGIGAGQMKRVDAARLAAMIAESYGDTVKRMRNGF